MKVIPVDTYPLEKTYDSPEAAIKGAENNPRQPKARADSRQLAGTTIVDAFWTDDEFVICFSNEKYLHVWASPGRVQWNITDTSPEITNTDAQYVGSSNKIMQWEKIGNEVIDCSALIAKRRGAEFQRFFINEFGLCMYLKNLLILVFAVVRRTDTNQPILYVCETD